MPRKKAAWTVMVYLAGDNNLSTECLFALTEMKKAAPGDQINVLAQFDPRDEYVPTHRYEINRNGSGSTLFDDIIDTAKFDSKSREVRFQNESDNAVALARTAAAFNVPVVVSTSASRVYSGPLLPAIQDALLAAGAALLQAGGLLAVAPLLKTVIKKMKARFQNRQGPPLLQGYYDLAKLLRKERVRSEVASWVYVAGPRVYFAAAVAATTLVPVLFPVAPLEAAGGILLLVGTLALGRFALATAALDTGSPFGGMGASRDMTIAALAEPALMLGLFASALAAGSMNLGELVRTLVQQGINRHPADILAFAGLFVIVIAETGRIPVDNPATHLELTMIHEAMVLEYAGPDLALVEWASAVKEVLYLTLLVDLFMPVGIAISAAPVAVLVAIVAWGAKVFVLAITVTVVESTNAKLRLFRVPELVSISLGLGFLALAIRFL